MARLPSFPPPSSLIRAFPVSSIAEIEHPIPGSSQDGHTISGCRPHHPLHRGCDGGIYYGRIGHFRKPWESSSGFWPPSVKGFCNSFVSLQLNIYLWGTWACLPRWSAH